MAGKLKAANLPAAKPSSCDVRASTRRRKNAKKRQRTWMCLFATRFRATGSSSDIYRSLIWIEESSSSISSQIAAFACGQVRCSS